MMLLAPPRRSWESVSAAPQATAATPKLAACNLRGLWDSEARWPRSTAVLSQVWFQGPLDELDKPDKPMCYPTAAPSHTEMLREEIAAVATAELAEQLILSNPSSTCVTPSGLPKKSATFQRCFCALRRAKIGSPPAGLPCTCTLHGDKFASAPGAYLALVP